MEPHEVAVAGERWRQHQLGLVELATVQQITVHDKNDVPDAVIQRVNQSQLAQDAKGRACRLREMVAAALARYVLLPVINEIEQAAGIAEDEGVIMVLLHLVQVVHRRHQVAVDARPGMAVVIVIMPDDLERVEDDIQAHDQQEG